MEKKKRKRSVNYESFRTIQSLPSALEKLTKEIFHKEIFIKFKRKVSLGILKKDGIYAYIEKVDREEKQVEIKVKHEGTFKVNLSDIEYISFTYKNVPYKFENDINANPD